LRRRIAKLAQFILSSNANIDDRRMVFVIALYYALIPELDTYTLDASNLLLDLGADLTRRWRQRVGIRLYLHPFLTKEREKFITIDTTI